MPRARDPTQPVRPSDAQPPANALRAVVDSRQRVQTGSPNCEISPLLVSDKTCRYLLTVLGIGPRTASKLEIPIDIGGLSQPRQAGIALRPRAPQPPVGHVDIIGVRLASEQQVPQGPAHIPSLQPYAKQQPLRATTPGAATGGGIPWQGAQSGREKKDQGDLHSHEGQVPYAI